MSNIRSFADINSNGDKKRNKISSFTGGKKSGLAVENPSDDDYDSKNIGDVKKKVIVYKNGYIVDDKPFQKQSPLESQKFIEDLRAGYAPRDLMDNVYNQNAIHVALEDKSDEVYILKNDDDASSSKIFGGIENLLNPSLKSKPLQSVNLNIIYDDEFKVDRSKPIATLQIRLHDGKKVTKEFNEDSKIADLHDFIIRAAPVDGDYIILHGFPPQEITSDVNLTLKEAGIMNTVLTQSLR